MLAGWLREQGFEGKFIDYGSTALVVVLITYFSIVLGELVPKRLGQLDPEAVARRVARPMQWLATVGRPFVQLLSGSTRLVLRALGVKDENARAVTEEEIHAMLVEGSDAGVIEEHEHDMVRNVFRLDDRQIGSLMVPRARRDLARCKPAVGRERQTHRADRAYPLSRGARRTARHHRCHQRAQPPEKGAARAARRTGRPMCSRRSSCPRASPGLELLQNFRTSGVQLAFVVDEYGEVLGIVTLRDVLEAITGEFRPEQAEDQWAVQRADGSWLLDGLIPVPELKDRLELQDRSRRGRATTP